MKKKGRPETPSYRKKNMRFSKVEDTFKNNLHRIESDKDRQIILDLLEELKQPTVAVVQ